MVYSQSPLVNEKDPSGASTIVLNEPPRQRLNRVEPLGNGSMRLALPLRPDSVTKSDVGRTVLPRDRASAVTTLFEEHYASLVRMARLLVDDRETAEDVVDAVTALYRRWTAVRAAFEQSLKDAETRLRRYQAAIAPGVDPAAMVEAINQAQALRTAAQDALNSRPANDAQRAAFAARLAEQGLAVVDEPGHADSTPARRLSRLTDADG